MAIVDRAQVLKLLWGLDHPGSKQDLVTFARDTDAGDDIQQVLQSLPMDSFHDLNEVGAAIRGAEGSSIVRPTL